MRTAFGLLALGFALMLAAFNDRELGTRITIIALAIVAFILLFPTIAN